MLLALWCSGTTNGHYYEAVLVGDPGRYLMDRCSGCKQRSDAGGYLATATSAEENTFIFGLIDSEAFWVTDFQNNLGPWLGGYYDGDLANIATTDWKWVTGEAWGYTNWETASKPEPNNNPGEFYINYFNYGSQAIRDSTWNNMVNIYPETEISGNTEVRGYIIEWDANPVPVPAAIWLFVSGLLGIFVTGRKARSC